MTGREVARRMMAYKGDAGRICFQISLADDAARRITQLIGSQTGEGGIKDKVGETAARKTDLARAKEARKACFYAEIKETARLISQITSPECGEVMRRTCLLGESQRQIAGGLGRSEESVRSLRRRGWNVLEQLKSDLDEGETYRMQRQVYESIMLQAEDVATPDDPLCPSMPPNDPL